MLRVYSCTLPRTNIVMPGLSDGLEKSRTIWGSLYRPVKSACGPAPGASHSWFSFRLPPDVLLAASAAILRPPLPPPSQDIPRRRLPHRCLGLRGLFPLAAPGTRRRCCPGPVSGRLRTQVPPPSLPLLRSLLRGRAVTKRLIVV